MQRPPFSSLIANRLIYSSLFFLFQIYGHHIIDWQYYGSSSPVVSLRTTTKKEPQVHQASETQVFDEELPVIATDIKDVEFQPTPIRQPATKQQQQQFKSPVFMSSRRPTNNSISFSSSDGFDNVAFEGFLTLPKISASLNHWRQTFCTWSMSKDQIAECTVRPDRPVIINNSSSHYRNLTRPSRSFITTKSTQSIFNFQLFHSFLRLISWKQKIRQI